MLLEGKSDIVLTTKLLQEILEVNRVGWGEAQAVSRRDKSLLPLALEPNAYPILFYFISISYIKRYEALQFT